MVQFKLHPNNSSGEREDVYHRKPMKRDMNLIRDLLLFYESDCTIEYPSADKQSIGEHLCLLAEFGLIEGNIAYAGTTQYVVPPGGRYVAINGKEFYAFRLTWDGHDFLATARDDNGWKSALKKLGPAFGGMTLGMIKDYLELQAREKLGL